MPRTTVNKPQDDIYVLERFEIDPFMPEVIEFTYPGLGQVVEAPSSYHLKVSDLLRIEISQVNPAWLYSGLDYDRDNVVGWLTFRQDTSDLGIRTPLYIPNIKKQGQEPNLIGISLPSEFNQTWVNDVPVNYYGKALEDRTPDQAGHHTILSKVIDETKIKVNMLSACDFEIEVVEDLTEDQWFYVPVGNPKGMGTTVWGKVGSESTLPAGASAGLIKVRTETLLDSQRGQYTITGDQFTALTRPTQQIYSQEERRTFGVGATVVTPDWYTDLFTDTVKTTDQWKTLNAMVEANTNYMSCGYITRTSTVGTGLFVKGTNQVAKYSFGRTGLGMSHIYTFSQVRDATVDQVPLHDFIQVDEFLETLARSTGTDTEILPEDVIIPFAAAELQFESKAVGPYRPLQDLRFNYRYMVHNTTLPIGITPVYLPPDLTQHCYVPPLVCRGSTRIHMLSALLGLDDNVALTLRPSQSWLIAYEGTIAAVPDVILDNKAIEVGTLSDPITEYSRGKMGFFGNRSVTSRYNYSSTGTHVSTTFTWKGALYWANPDVHPTVGRDYTQVGEKSVCNAIFSAMIMAFVGVFPAGTPAGTYKWKPFQTVEAQSGCLNATSPQYISSYLTPRIKSEVTSVPLMGHNIITLDVKSLQWTTSADSDPYYTARRVLEYVDDDYTNTTRLSGSYYLTVTNDTVPLIGYPLANKPLLMDMDGWTGDWACEVEDMSMTAPFYDKAIGEWIVVGASAQMKKMYRIEVEMDDTETYCTGFLRVRDSRELFDTPFGNWQRVLGICHTKDIHYVDGSENDHLVMYGITAAAPSTIDGGSNLIVATCRTYMEWDADKDTVSRVKVADMIETPNFVIDPDINWPHSVAVMYPWIYVLGFAYQNQPTNPVIDPLISAQRRITGNGWQMCLWKIEITSGIVNDVIPLKSLESLRFSYGVPANDVDSRTLYRQDKNSVGKMMKYSFGIGNVNVLPASVNLPKISAGSQFPSISGLCCVSGSLLAFSNYSEKMVMINPITGFIEELGTNVYPFIYPFNKNVAVEKETVSTLAKFGGKYFHTSHPFFGLCLGDGTPPNNYGAGIDIQDVTNGQTLDRLVKLKNNLLRDQIMEIELTVPEPDVLPNSEMLSLSLDGVTFSKTITVEGPIEPCATKNFFVRLEPQYVDESVLQDKILLYINAKFARKTVFFGYIIRLDAPLEG